MKIGHHVFSCRSLPLSTTVLNDKAQVRWLQGNNNGVFMFLVVFVYIIFVILFKIRHVNRLPLLDSLWLNLRQVHGFARFRLCYGHLWL